LALFASNVSTFTDTRLVLESGQETVRT